jgi:pyruvate,water dikinase
MRPDAVEAEAPTMSSSLPLDAATDARVCGHKAATLAALRGLGFDVPDGFVIPAGVQPTRDDIAGALSRLGEGPVAVRSSGLAEDLADASFAGQYDTVLNVRGVDAVLEAAAACVTSARDARIESYGQAARPMAVLVQRMIQAEAAGVAFSANPLTGNRGEVRINATRGLGDQLVAGAIDGDEWLVSGDQVTAIAEPQKAIGPGVARRVAELARKAEAVRMAPQDIEWAIAGDRLWLLQSRPITALPVAPAIETPKGTWQKDAGHFSDPISPFAASTQFRHAGQFLTYAIETWGLLPERMLFRVIGHEPYLHIDPDDGGKAPPPWWLLGLVARVVPSLRRKLRASADAIGAGLLESVPAEWETSQRPRLRKQIQQFAAIDLAALEHDALFRHIDTLSDFYADSLKLHFHLAIPYAVGLRDLADACEQLLGWNLQKTVGLLQGLSRTAAAATDELAAIVRRTRPGGETRQLLQARVPDLVTRLDHVDPAVATELREYLQFWGLRPLGSEPGYPTVAEQPQLFADAIADLLSEDTSPDLSPARQALKEEARKQLTGPALQRFDAALSYAEHVYPLREDNVILTDQLPVGLLRLAALEAGRRLVSLNLLNRAEDALMLTATELRDAIRSRRDVRGAVARVKAEHAWVRANRGPLTYGPEPGKTPDLRGLPAPARRINGGLLWLIDEELTPAPKAEGRAVLGLGVSPGVHRGRVRVITTPDQLHTLRQGEVLVCPFTSSAWMMVFRRAGAIVADAGSVLSHTAIVAREFALPAVVGAANATTSLADGDEVIVDGTSGVVTRC